jgi:hypothetical protein
MNTPQPQTSGHTAEPEWGAAQHRPPQRWSTKKTLAAVAIAVGVASAGGAAIYAAGSSTEASASQGGMQGGPGGGPQLGGGQSGLMNALHGEFVVSDGNGGYTTELMQTGTVTAVSSSSLTAKSDDGYTKTYTIDSGTAVGNNAEISSIANGDTVTVVATVSGDTATVDTVSEGTGQAGQGPGAGGQSGQQQGTAPRQQPTGQG